MEQTGRAPAQHFVSSIPLHPSSLLRLQRSHLVWWDCQETLGDTEGRIGQGCENYLRALRVCRSLCLGFCEADNLPQLLIHAPQGALPPLGK